MELRYLTIAMLAIIAIVSTAFLMLQYNQAETASNTQAPSENITSSTPVNWILLNWTNTTTPDGVKVTLFVYQVNATQNQMIKAANNLIETCENLSRQHVTAFFCNFNSQELRKEAENNDLAVLAVIVEIMNTGHLNQTLRSTGPHCGPSFNIEFLEGKSNETITAIEEPITATIRYNVTQGKVIIGYNNMCEQALIIRTLKPGHKVESIFGFLVLKGTKLSITAYPILGRGPLSLDVYVPEN